MQTLFDAAKECLDARSVAGKLALTEQAAEVWRRGELSLEPSAPAEAAGEVGRPDRPRLVGPRELAGRSPFTREGRAALIHAIAHIEFNAVNLAWDAVYRFRDMPRQYYDDWVRVAVEEASHFRLLHSHLKDLGFSYGDFDAHNGLWEMAVETAHDPLVRMALVPRVLEARGLDVTPGMMERLRSAGDLRAVEILELILREEVGHVEIGSRWFHHLCAQRGVDPVVMFRELIARHMNGRIKGPFHREARLDAGFSAEEMDYLESL